MKQTLRFFSKKAFNKILFIGFFVFLSNIQAVNAQSVTLTPNGAWVPSMTTTVREALTPTTGQLVYDTSLNLFYYYNGTVWTALSAAAGLTDNLGNHTATQNINIGTNYLSNGNTNYGLRLNTSGNVTITGSSNGSNLLNIGDATNVTSVVSFKSITQDWRIGVGDGLGDSFTITDETNDETPLVIGNNNGSNTLRLNNSKVGVNNSNPEETLDVSGKTKTTNFQMTNGASTNYVLKTDDNGNASWANLNTFYTESDPQVTSSTNNYIPKWNGTSLADGIIYDSGTNIGIGTTDPSEKLHIVGNTIIDAGKLKFANTGESVFVGNDAGTNDDLTHNQNVFIGEGAGSQNVSGNLNTFIGSNAGITNTSSNNVGIGQAALEANTTGSFNTAVGRFALGTNTTGGSNVAIGEGAGQNSTGDSNTFIGQASGKNATGNGGVFVGNNAGANETNNDKLYIANSNTTTPLIYGDFDSKTVTINDNFVTKFFKMTNGALANYVLKTDDNGNASWANLNTFYTESDPQVTSSTNNYIPKWNGTSLADGIIYDNGTNIGIGTPNPTSKLDIQGSGQITANVQSSGDHSYYVGSAPSGKESVFQFKTYSTGTNYSRWGFGKSTAAETGSETGSDFFINRYSDAGSFLSQPLTITRSTGQVNITLLSATTAKATTLNVSGAVTMAVTSKTASYSVGDADYCIVFTGSTAGLTLTLPASPVAGRVLFIINHSSVPVEFTPSISSSATTSISSTAGGNELQIIYDGTNWRVMN